MKSATNYSAIMALIMLGYVTPVYAVDNSSDSFSSAFIIAFCAYAALIVVLHLGEFIRLKFFKKNDLSPVEKSVCSKL